MLVFLDLLPVIFVLTRAAFIDFENATDSPIITVVRSTEYSVFYFIIYFTDLLLTGVAMRTLLVKTNQLSGSSTVGFVLYENA